MLVGMQTSIEFLFLRQKNSLFKLMMIPLCDSDSDSDKRFLFESHVHSLRTVDFHH